MNVLDFSLLYDKIYKKCGCSIFQIRLFEHSCILKVVNLDNIRIWLYRDENLFINLYNKGFNKREFSIYNKDNTDIIYYIGYLMCCFILYKKFDIISYIIDLEEKFDIDLNILFEIIKDYKKWSKY